MSKFLLVVLLCTKFLCLGYVTDVHLFYHKLIHATFLNLRLLIILIALFVLGLNIKRFYLERKLILLSLLIAAVIGILIKVFTYGDPIYYKLFSLFRSRSTTYYLIFFIGISVTMEYFTFNQFHLHKEEGSILSENVLDNFEYRKQD